MVTSTKKKHENTYTQREWDRVVGYGKVPEEYKTTEEVNSEETLLSSVGLEQRSSKP